MRRWPCFPSSMITSEYYIFEEVVSATSIAFSHTFRLSFSVVHPYLHLRSSLCRPSTCPQIDTNYLLELFRPLIWRRWELTKGPVLILATLLMSHQIYLAWFHLQELPAFDQLKHPLSRLPLNFLHGNILLVQIVACVEQCQILSKN